VRVQGLYIVEEDELIGNDDTGLLLVEFCQAAGFIPNYSMPKLL
jgi:hypothetical protein